MFSTNTVLWLGAASPNSRKNGHELRIKNFVWNETYKQLKPIITCAIKMLTEVHLKANWIKYFPWVYWRTTATSHPVFWIFFSTCSILLGRFRTSEGEGMSFIVKVWADLRNERTEYSILEPCSLFQGGTGAIEWPDTHSRAILARIASSGEENY